MPFLGTVPDGVRRIVHEHARTWPAGPVYVGCSGNLTLERTLAPLGFELHGNDVNPYSCALGWYFSGQKVPFALREESREELGWLEGSLDDGAGTVATLMLGTSFLASAGRDNAWHRRQVRAYRDQWPALHAKTVERLEGASVRLASFHAGDVVPWLDDLPAGAPVVSFPPFWRGGYEVMFEAIGEHFAWPEPAYEVMDEDGKDQMLAAVTGHRHWLIGVHIQRPELAGALRGMVQPTNRAVPIYVYASGSAARLVMPHQALEDVPMPRLGPEEELGRRMALHPLTAAQFSLLRSQWMDRRIAPAAPALACAVAVDGKLIGAFAYNPPRQLGMEPGGAYLLSDFPVPWTRYRRLAKLIVMAALSAEARALLQRYMSRRLDHVYTSAFTDHPASPKYGRGIPGMALVKRTETPEARHAYELFYRAPLGAWTCREGLATWRQRHGQVTR